MITGIKPKELLFRDGTSQGQRATEALDPKHFGIEERSLEDWLRFAQAYACKLRFYNEDNKPQGNWEAFLIGDYQQYKQADSQEKKAIREKWISELKTYLDNPERFEGDTYMQEQFAKPHLALLLTFIKLLGVVQQQMNGITGRHLDYFYRTVLGIGARDAVPDVANVVFELVDDVSEYLLPKGTRLLAGQDAEGNDLNYETTQDTFINRAQLKQIKNTFADRELITLNVLREKHKSDPDQGLMAIMKLAIGSPGKMDPLPLYRGNAAQLNDIADDLQKPKLKLVAQDYINNSLYLELNDFNYLLTLNSTSDQGNWEQAYEVLIKAYRTKITQSRITKLREIHEAPQGGYLQMWKFALGERQPGDDLPVFQGRQMEEKQLIELYEILDEGDQDTEASNYVTQELYMTRSKFMQCILIYVRNRDGQPMSWDQHYEILENAWSNKEKFDPGNPEVNSYRNIYAIPDTLQAMIGVKDQEGDSTRFKTFGRRPIPGLVEKIYPARMGLAISSPQFQLSEGIRNIQLTCLFRNNTNSGLLNRLQEIEKPFECLLSTSESWIVTSPTTVKFAGVPDPQDPTAGIIQMQLRIELDENHPPISALTQEGEQEKAISKEPVLCLMWNNQVNGEGAPYHFLKELVLRHIEVEIEVQQIKKLLIQHEGELIDAKKPFEPFGNEPEPGKLVYFAHPELCSKPLKNLSIQLEWMNPPTAFNEYYINHQMLLNKLYGREGAQAIPPPGNEQFAAKMYMQENKRQLDVDEFKLFDADATTTVQRNYALKNLLEDKQKNFTFEHIEAFDPETDPDIQDLNRYYMLELGRQDFYHRSYPLILQQAGVEAIKNEGLLYVVAEPYTPKIKKIQAGYTSGFSLDFDEAQSQQTHQIIHLHPFGSSVAQLKGKGSHITLLPTYINEGELYLGFEQLRGGSSLTLYFQLAEGSSNPDIDLPKISWSYLLNNEWQDIPEGSFISDTTNGLINTGIITLNIPREVDEGAELFGEALSWLRISATDYTSGVADTVNILSQAVQAVYVDTGNSSEHLGTLLNAGQITETALPLPEIKNVLQPYTSSRGKPAESEAAYYVRVSERLRHKNRAITMWDYERLVLDRFPEIHKAKCVPGDFTSEEEQYGVVDLIVVPDIRGKRPFNPFQPKASSDTLAAIQGYLNQRKPVFATVKVKNPTFLQVKARLAVRFKQKGNEAYFARMLNESLRRYLSPWAYDESSDITIGGSIYAHMLVNFVAEQPYVEYVAGMKLFQSENGKDFKNASLLNGGENKVQASRPDQILVSVLYHEIDLVKDDGYSPEDFTGIDYMKVELDFIVM